MIKYICDHCGADSELKDLFVLGYRDIRLSKDVCRKCTTEFDLDKHKIEQAVRDVERPFIDKWRKL